jgi:hypothetical protein
MALTQYMMKNILDWALGGAAAVQPAGQWLQWATGTPNTSGASDGPFSSRITVSFAAMNSPQGSKTNLGAITGATPTVAATCLGWNLYDSSVGGNRIAFGTLSASISCRSNTDNPSFAAGALKITLT